MIALVLLSLLCDPENLFYLLTNQIQNLKLIVIQSFAILCKNENLALGEDNFFLISLSFLITCLLDDLWLLWGQSYMLITTGSLRVEQPSTIF